jgi:hypothetical protein
VIESARSGSSGRLCSLLVRTGALLFPPHRGPPSQGHMYEKAFDQATRFAAGSPHSPPPRFKKAPRSTSGFIQNSHSLVKISVQRA